MSSKLSIELPNEIEIPQYPIQLKLSILAALVFLIGGIFYPPLFSAMAAFLVIAVGIVTYNSTFKAIYFTKRAITKYKSENFSDCFKLCKKALKYNDNFHPAILLMSWSMKKGKF